MESCTSSLNFYIHIFDVQLVKCFFFCSEVGIIIIPFITIPSLPAISSSKDHYGWSSLWIPAFVDDQPSNT